MLPLLVLSSVLYFTERLRDSHVERYGDSLSDVDEEEFNGIEGNEDSDLESDSRIYTNNQSRRSTSIMDRNLNVISNTSTNLMEQIYKRGLGFNANSHQNEESFENRLKSRKFNRNGRVKRNFFAKRAEVNLQDELENENDDDVNLKYPLGLTSHFSNSSATHNINGDLNVVLGDHSSTVGAGEGMNWELTRN